MKKKFVWIILAVVVFWAAQFLFKRALILVVDYVLTDSYLQESTTPSLSEIEAMTRMKLPKGYQNLKALYNVETRDGTVESMTIKLSASRSEIKAALSDAGMLGNLGPNPKRRSIKNGDIKIPWWNPDGEKNVLSGYYRIEPSTGEQAGKVWDTSILLAQQEKGLDTPYLDVSRHCQDPSVCKK